MYICFDVMQAVLFMLHNVLEFTIWNYNFKYLLKFDSIYSYIKGLIAFVTKQESNLTINFLIYLCWYHKAIEILPLFSGNTC